MSRILAIDPSGTGTTGIFFTNGSQKTFQTFPSKDWREHLVFLVQQVEQLKPELVSYEHTNFISLRGKDMTSLLKLMGAIESLVYFPGVEKVAAIPVNQVKGWRGKLLKGEKTIAGLEYKKGKGWYYSGQKISTHELDAYLVYWMWESKAENKPKNELIGKTIEADKNKPKTKEKVIKEELLEDIDDLPEERECIEILDDFPDEPEEPEDIDICYGPEEDDLPEEPEEIEDHE